VSGQNVHRLALAFLVLVPDLSGQINDRNDDPNSAKHLPHCANHLPVHSYYISGNSTILNTGRPTSEAEWEAMGKPQETAQMRAEDAVSQGNASSSPE
jgi:hypothetical protein